MEAVRTQLDGLASEYERLLAQLSCLREENGRLKERLPSPLGLRTSEEAVGEVWPATMHTEVAMEPTRSMYEAPPSTFDGEPEVMVHKVQSRLSARSVQSRLSARSGQSRLSPRNEAHPPPRPGLRRAPSCLSADSAMKVSRLPRSTHSAASNCTLPGLRPQWCEFARQSSSCADLSSAVGMGYMRGLKNSERDNSRLRRGVSSGDLQVDSSCLQGFVLEPTSFKRIVWVWMSIAALAYDLVMLPLDVFGRMEDDVFFVVNAIIATFWMMDIVASCFLGYYEDGRVEMRPRMIALRYLKTWFGIDVSLSVIHIFDLLLWGKSVDAFNALRIWKASRMVRVLRIFRLVRLMKVVPLLLRRTESIQSDVGRTLASIIQIMIAITCCCHILACGWYGIGTSDMLPSGRTTWVMQVRLDDSSVPDRGGPYYYATALHWCFTQFTPGSMEVVPRNTVERWYTVIVLLLGLVMFSSLISSITNAMTKYRERNSEKFKQRDCLYEYLKDHRISLGLGNQIFDYLQHRGFALSSRTIDRDIPCLKMLPEKLRVRLFAEMYTPSLIAHPLFFYFDEVAPFSMQTICRMAMSQQIVIEGHRLFHLGEKSSKTFFITHGTMEYSLGMSLVPTDRLSSGDYVAEASLWVDWQHKGHLEAHEVTEVAVLDAIAFARIARNTKIVHHCKTYALRFHSMLLGKPTDALTDIACDPSELWDNAITRTNSLAHDGGASRFFAKAMSGLRFN